ncbi:MAG TPA: 2-aminoethylphosphonate ABC transporter permease subunit [Casimicrobiaceae bacterium]|nr:2-aminoethylphosphonate ABC transporter permease subunit [Casimicrobiaceae bacterium]
MRAGVEWNADRLWIAPPLLILAALFFFPLALIVRQALGGDAEALSFAKFTAVVSSAEFRHALRNTLTIALSATAGCLVLGFVLSVLIAFTPFPGSRFLARMIDTFIALPTFLVALAFTFIYGSAGMLNESLMALLHRELPPVDFLYSQWGVILSEVTVYTPFVMRPLLAAFSLIDASQIEVAASLGARPLRIVSRIILPAALPALVAGGSLCLLLTVNEFGIVLFIGAKDVITLPLLIYDKAIQQFDYTTACVIAVVNVALSIALYSLYRYVVATFGGRRAGLV